MFHHISENAGYVHKMVSRFYKNKKSRPAIHLYLDTSGSLPEDGTLAIAREFLAAAVGKRVPVYVNAFAHVLGSQYRILYKGWDVRRGYEQLEKIPRIPGGTDFTNVWDYVSKTYKRKNELSVIVTDFGCFPPGEGGEYDKDRYPENLYYVPTNTEPSHTREDIERFCRRMEWIEPDIRKKIWDWTQ